MSPERRVSWPTTSAPPRADEPVGGRPAEGVGERRLELDVGDATDPVRAEEAGHATGAADGHGDAPAAATVTRRDRPAARSPTTREPAGRLVGELDLVASRARDRRRRGVHRERARHRAGRGRRATRRASTRTLARSTGRSRARRWRAGEDRSPALNVRRPGIGLIVTVTCDRRVRPIGRTPVGQGQADVLDRRPGRAADRRSAPCRPRPCRRAASASPSTETSGGSTVIAVDLVAGRRRAGDDRASPGRLARLAVPEDRDL